jgi:hypothetical protein
MSCNLEHRIEERTEELRIAVEEHNTALSALNTAKEKIVILQGRLAELQSLKEDSPEHNETVSPEVV